MSRSSWKPSAAEVDAAWLELWTADTRYQTREWQNERVAAALIAAHDAAPEPDTAEFEAALHRLVSRAIAYGRGTAEHDAVDVPFQRLIDMYKERR